MTASRTVSAVSLALGLVLAGAGVAQDKNTAAGRFAMFDANHDGVVDESEYGNQSTFNAIDSNHDNRISADEVQAVLGPQQDGQPSAADRIRPADMNGDGQLTDEELRRGAETRFQWMDTNKDGNLDEAEFRAGFGVPIVR
ncbi:MAG: EF-hand domain-containing protein [Sphingomicrobium sp.]